MHNQHTRGMATTRHRSPVERDGRKAFIGDKGLVHTIKGGGGKDRKKTKISNLKKKRFEHIELTAKLLDYFSRNKQNINQSPYWQ